MPERRKLTFSSEQDVIAEVEHLRREGYEQVGAWSLPRMCWHLSQVIDMTLTPAKPNAKASASQKAAKDEFLAELEAGLPPGTPTSPNLTPPPRVELSEIDAFLDRTRTLASFAHPVVSVPMFGAVPFSDIRRMHLAHAAHHLSFLVPNA